MSEFDVSKLLKALDNEENEQIINLDYVKINKIKNNVLKRLHIKANVLRELKTKLKLYRFVDELPDLKYGSYIRWISLKNPENIYLTTGGIVCEIKVVESGIAIICKNSYNRMFQIKLSENLIFQKLTKQEQIILSAMDLINS